MMPIVSRSTIIRKCKELFKHQYDDYDEPDVVAKRTQERFNILLQERLDLQETMEKSFFTLMKDSGMGAISYVKALGEIDSELPGKNPNQFELLLQHFWDGVSGFTYVFSEVLDTLCNAFPNYERVVLKSAFLNFMDGTMDVDYDFAILLERMADFDQIDGMDHFTSDVDKVLPAELEEPIVNVLDQIEEIIDQLDIYSPFYDVIWILENRFGVDEVYLAQLLYDKICDLYGYYDLNELLRAHSLNDFFKVPDGYKLFFIYLPTIMRNSYPDTGFKILLTHYNVNIDVDARQVE